MESIQSRALSLFHYRGNCIFENAFGEEKGKFESGAAKIFTMHRIPSPSHALHTLYDKKASIIDALKCTAWNMIQIIDILLDFAYVCMACSFFIAVSTFSS